MKVKARNVQQKKRIMRADATVRKLAAAIKVAFGYRRLKVEVSSEVVPGTKLRRVSVVAPSFRRMDFIERQTFIWRIANNALTPQEIMMVTMILTLTPQDVTGVMPP